MRKAFAVLSSAALLAVAAAGPAAASHKSKSPHANPPGQVDCAIEVDPLGLCLG